jgi:tripartite-type tricarboxylate transporter receptor subunit TctC
MHTLHVVAVAVTLFASAAAPQTSLAQTYPAKPIRLVMSVSGGAEVVVRIAAQRWLETTGQPMIMEVQSGAGGAVGAEMAAKATPDGYTLLLATASAITMRPHLAKSTPYDPIRDFTPIIRAGEAVLVVAANPNAPFASIRDMVQYAKSNPGKLTYGSSGVGTNHHLSAELLRRAAGIDMLHVPYKTAPQLMNDVIGGQLPVAFTILATISSNVKAGKLRVLGVYNSKRYHLIPDVPTLAEEVPGYEPPPGWMGYLGPANLPPALVTRLNTDLAKFYTEPQMQARADAAGIMVNTSTPAEFAELLKREYSQVGRVVKAAGIQPE